MKYYLKIKNKKSGSMIVELLIALAVIGLSIVAFTNIAQKSINISKQSLDNTQASFLLEEGAEVVRLYRDVNWANITSMNVNTDYYINFDSVNNAWYFTLTPVSVDKFTRKIIFQNVNRDDISGDIVVSGDNDPGTRLVRVVVSWNEGAVVITKNLQFYISDIFS